MMDNELSIKKSSKYFLFPKRDFTLLHAPKCYQTFYNAFMREKDDEERNHFCSSIIFKWKLVFMQVTESELDS